MFCHQCRYCKVSFEQWGKLVSHKRDEHQEEFEALKRALLQRKQETARKKLLLLEGVEMNGLDKSPSTKPRVHTMSELRIHGVGGSVVTPLRKSTSTKEVDAKDLENQEISLCIPSPAVHYRSSSSSSSFTSASSSSLYSTGIFNSSLSRVHPRSAGTATFNRIIIPPREPIALNLNWISPSEHSNKAAVLYHQMNDTDEIEICVSPSDDGSRISLTKHPVPGSLIENILSGDKQRYSENELRNNNLIQQPEVVDRISFAHVVREEELQEELQMTCSKNCNPPPARNSVIISAEDCSSSNKTKRDLEILKNQGKRLQKLHSQIRHHTMTRTKPDPGGNKPKRIRSEGNSRDGSGFHMNTRASPRRSI